MTDNLSILVATLKTIGLGFTYVGTTHKTRAFAFGHASRKILLKIKLTTDATRFASGEFSDRVLWTAFETLCYRFAGTAIQCAPPFAAAFRHTGIN